VTPEREHLVGWQSATSKREAAATAFWACPACAARITEEERDAMNQAARLVHRGQTIGEDGTITGEVPATDTLGFRWNAFNNLFWLAGDVATEEWTARSDEIEESAREDAERKLCQFYWATPYASPALAIVPLHADQIRRRTQSVLRQGFVPDDCVALTMGVDVGKWVGWWLLIAWAADASGHVVDYGSYEVPSKSMDTRLAVLAGLRGLRDENALPGWPTTSGKVRIPEQVWVDVNYETDACLDFIRESGTRFRACVGLGVGKAHRRRYNRPTRTGSIIQHVGHEYHAVWRPEDRCHVIEVNADYWKTWVHERLITPMDQPGALSLYYSADDKEHLSLAKHWTSERQIEEFIAGEGIVRRWECVHRANHWFDCSMLAAAAGHLCGVRLVRPPSPPPRPPRRDPEPGPGDRQPLFNQPFSLLERVA
jgi:phage terminase large subunit GpA-like protein